MIQIRRNNLEELANRFFEKLNPKTKKGDRFNLTEALIPKLKNATPKSYFTFLIDERNNFSRLKTLITSSPKDLKKEFIDGKVGEKYNQLSQKNKNEVKNFFKNQYENLRGNETGYWLGSNLNVKTCPYCNREYTFTYRTAENKPKLLYDFDHFFDKGTYPYLALSFYNLIPSCSICNSRFKHSEKFDIDKHFHPYFEGFSKEALFTTQLICKSDVEKEEDFGMAFFEGNLNSFEVNLNDNDCEKTKRHKKVFQIEQVYNEHKDYIYEMIQKSQVYNESYLNELFQSYEGTLFRNREDVLKLALGNYLELEDFEKRPLSKLTHDIAKELGLLD
ncbi:hypothetical protein V9L05_23745 (plasmid) [Bernardetia sp. Wsw4-3y2]|uniref:hypothetical protein n=1 Tax=Bernardetia sp. Wsw4-3y2 TaxID=3127471 RepID=UPI0030D49967